MSGKKELNTAAWETVFIQFDTSVIPGILSLGATEFS